MLLPEELETGHYLPFQKWACSFVIVVGSTSQCKTFTYLFAQLLAAKLFQPFMIVSWCCFLHSCKAKPTENYKNGCGMQQTLSMFWSFFFDQHPEGLPCCVASILNRNLNHSLHLAILGSASFFFPAPVMSSVFGCVPYRFPRVFGDEFGDKFGDKFSDSLNLVSNVVTNLVMNLVNHHILWPI